MYLFETRKPNIHIGTNYYYYHHHHHYIIIIIIVIIISVCSYIYIYIYIYLHIHVCIIIIIINAIISCKGAVGLGVGSVHDLNSHNFKSRVSNPRTTGYLHFNTPFESSNLPGSGPICPDVQIELLKAGRTLDTLQRGVQWMGGEVDWGSIIKLNSL